MTDILFNVFEWIRQDFRSHPLRCLLEILAWFLSISCSIVMAVTVPHPPFLILYPLFITQCVIFAWASYTRRSFGMLSNYILLSSIDLIALTRLILM
jgi:hypothetical protein